MTRAVFRGRVQRRYYSRLRPPPLIVRSRSATWHYQAARTAFVSEIVRNGFWPVGVHAERSGFMHRRFQQQLAAITA